MTTLDDLMHMGRSDLHDVLKAGHPLDRSKLANTQYLGVDLSLPWAVRRLLWHTFRKAFHHDESLGELRGWNVRMQQTGVDGEALPMTDRDGRQRTFGHYRVRDTGSQRFPGGWSGANFLDYTTAGNGLLDPGRVGFTPLVAVNEGCQDLLLGWEVVKIGPAMLPLPLYWALRRQGPLEVIEAVPNGPNR